VIDESPANLLPMQFDDLAQFVAEWGELETQDERYRNARSCRWSGSIAITARCAALGAIFDHLDSFPYDSPLPAAEALLFRMVMR